MKAYDLSTYQKVISTSGGRVTGTFVALRPPSSELDKKVWITAHEVTLWDTHEHKFGRMLHSGDLSGSVQDDVVTIHNIKPDARDDVVDVQDDLEEAMKEVARCMILATS